MATIYRFPTGEIITTTPPSTSPKLYQCRSCYGRHQTATPEKCPWCGATSLEPKGAVQ